MSIDTEVQVINRSQMINVPVDFLHPNPDNPRSEAGDVTELARSIREEGLKQPLLVIPATLQFGSGHFMIEDGYRRWVAAKTVVRGVKCIVNYPLPEEDLTQRELFMALTTSEHSEPLTPMERAKAYGRLRDECHLNQGQIAKRLGLTGGTISRYLSLLELDEKTQANVAAGRLGVERAIDAVKHSRAKTRKKDGHKPVSVGWEPDAFNDKHPLAKRAKIVCDARDHSGRRRFAGACHACWETVIRQDQYTVVVAELKASMPELQIPFIPPTKGPTLDTTVPLTTPLRANGSA